MYAIIVTHWKKLQFVTLILRDAKKFCVSLNSVNQKYMMYLHTQIGMGGIPNFLFTAGQYYNQFYVDASKGKETWSTLRQIKFIFPYLNIWTGIFLSQPFILFLWYTEKTQF